MRTFFRFLAALIAVTGVAFGVSPDASRRIETLKPLYPATPLVTAGESRSVIVVPFGEAWQETARDLAAAMRDLTGRAPRIVLDTEVVSHTGQLLPGGATGESLIALGNLGQNRLLAYLWGEGYTAEDDGFPGRGGWVVRTVHDPFAIGVNVVELAGSTPGDVAAASERLLMFIESTGAESWGLTAPVLVVQRGAAPAPYGDDPAAPKAKNPYRYASPAEFAATLDQRVAAVRSRDQNEAKAKVPTFVSLTTVLAELAEAWFHTGDPEYAALMQRLVASHRELIEVIPDRVEMEPASAAAMTWWDVVEELPVWSDADRLALTNAFLADALQGHEHTAAHDLVREGVVQVLTENHGTASATHSFEHWRYFSKYYDLPEEDYWMAVIRAVFAGQLASHQILEDASLYTPFCPDHAITYALRSHDTRYATLGIAETQLDFLMRAAYSNIGYSSGFGDSRFLQTPWLWRAVARGGVLTRDPVAQWWWRHYLPVACGINTYDETTPLVDAIPLTAPTAGVGIEVVPIYRQNLGTAKQSATLVTTPKEPAGDEWFNKVIFRDAWHPDAQYLLLDGAASWYPREGEPPGPKGHNQNDINSIITFTAESRMWLVDHTYELRAVQDHNSLTITRDGVMRFQNHLARLHEHAQGAGFGLSRSTFDDYSDATWERTIFWRRGEHFLVLDRAIAEQAGEFTVRCAWRGLGEHRLADGELRLEQAGRFGQIRSDGLAGSGVTEVPFPDAKSWSVYPHAQPVVKVFDQLQTQALQPGEAVAFANLLKASADAAALDATAVHRLDDRTVRVVDGETTTIYGVGALHDDWADCGAYALGPDGALLAGLTRIGQGRIAAAAPINVSVDAAGEVRVQLAHGTTVFVDGTRLELGKGEHVVGTPQFGIGLWTALRGIFDGLSSRQIGAIEDDARGAESAGGSRIALPTSIRELQEVVLAPGAEAVWLVTGDDGLSAFSTDGERQWNFSPGAACGALAVADVDGDGISEIMVGADDAKVYLLDSQGREKWNFTCKPTEEGAPPIPDEIHVVDLDGDGGRDIVVVANFVHVLAPDGSVRWEDYWRFFRNRRVGDVHAIDFTDLDHDGRLDVVAGVRLNYSVALAWDSDGTRIYPRDPTGQPDHKPLRVHLPNDVLALDLFADGGDAQLVVATNDELSFRWTGGDRDTLKGGDFSGGCVALAKVERPGLRPLVITATDMGAVFAYRAAGQRSDGLAIALQTEWRQILGDPITLLKAVASDDRALVLVGTRNGSARMIDANTGEVLGGLPKLTAAVTAGWVARGQVWFALADGTIRRIPFTRSQ